VIVVEEEDRSLPFWIVDPLSENRSMIDGFSIAIVPCFFLSDRSDRIVTPIFSQEMNDLSSIPPRSTRGVGSYISRVPDLSALLTARGLDPLSLQIAKPSL
jgi:hypothetical protein